jgi:2-hydroxychromene-2-carboxylate isomerase
MRDDRGVSVSAAPRFYLGAMSPYSWFAAERIERLLPAARWRGVFAGALFKQNGRVSWGLTDEREQKLADCDARAASYGLGPIRWPDPWPTNDLLVARAMAFCGDESLLKAYALAAMRLTFLDGVDLGELDAVLEAGRRVGIDERELRAAVDDPHVKNALRKANDEAVADGAFGVPTVIVAGELFWGDDRLQDAADADRASHAAPGSGRDASH